MSDNKAFAKELYEFLKSNDTLGDFAHLPEESGIAGLEDYLNDLSCVKDTIRDIEEIADEFDDHEVYVSTVKPLLRGLREIQGKLEAEQSKRMVENYEVKHAIHVGDKEVLFMEDAKNEETPYVVAYCSRNNPLNVDEFTEGVGSDDYLEMMGEFAGRLATQIEAVQKERQEMNIPQTVFGTEQCVPDSRTADYTGQILIVRAEVLRREYRNSAHQLFFAEHGNGCNPEASGRGVFGFTVSTGKKGRYNRADIAGICRAECMPDWAQDRLTVVKAEIAAERAKSNKDRGDAR
jgi:hypothetical protein